MVPVIRLVAGLALVAHSVVAGGTGNSLSTGCVSGECENGQGVFVYSSGLVYDGEWKDGTRHGNGVQTYTTGKYDGEWMQNTRHGKGAITYMSGDTYDGEWQYDKRHGQGVFTWADGTSYVGEYRDDQMHGKHRDEKAATTGSAPPAVSVGIAGRPLFV
jgi:hypothetical protein